MVDRFFLRPSPIRKFDECEAMSILSGPPSSLHSIPPQREMPLLSCATATALKPLLLSSPRVLIRLPIFFEEFKSSKSNSLNDFFDRCVMNSDTVFYLYLFNQRYVDDDEAIKNYFAAFHLHQTFPASIIVDNFGYFFDERNCQERYNNPRGRDLAIVRVLALCRNVISHANKSGRCEILLSDTHKGDTPRLLYIYKRWASCIYTIKGDGSGSFVLKKSYSGMANAKPASSAKYSIALQYLVLEDLVEEADN